MDVRGEYGFSSLVKQNKQAKICFVIYIAGFFFLKFFCYEVFAKQKKTEEPRLYYLYEHVCMHYRHTYTLVRACVYALQTHVYTCTSMCVCTIDTRIHLSRCQGLPLSILAARQRQRHDGLACPCERVFHAQVRALHQHLSILAAHQRQRHDGRACPLRACVPRSGVCTPPHAPLLRGP